MADDGLTPAELDAQDAAALPDREAMSLLDPTSGLDPSTLTSSALLDLDVNVDLDADAAAPINAGVAANANIAAPIDAAVSANILSPDSDSVAVASQTSVINQELDGVAIADPDQTSDISQGEVAEPAPAPATDAGSTS
jgi:hypothetical protein